MTSPILIGHDQLVSHPPGGRIQRYFFSETVQNWIKVEYVLSVSLKWLVVRLNTKFAKFFSQANVLLTRQVAGFQSIFSETIHQKQFKPE